VPRRVAGRQAQRRGLAQHRRQQSGLDLERRRRHQIGAHGIGLRGRERDRGRQRTFGADAREPGAGLAWRTDLEMGHDTRIGTRSHRQRQ